MKETFTCFLPSCLRRFPLKFLATLAILLTLGIGSVFGTEVIYTFTSNAWEATSGGSAANWTSGSAGTAFANNGIQVTTTTTGANGTSPVSFTNVSKIVATYNTNKSKGSGTIGFKVGTNDEVFEDWAYSGSSDGTSANFTCTHNYATPQSGYVKITLNTTTNSIYLVSVTITYSTATSYTLTFKEWDGGGGASGSPSTGSVIANATSFSYGATAPSKTGHSIEGFYTNTSAGSGVKVANGSREFLASVDGWTDGNKKYTKGANANLYIKWSPKVCAITLDKGTSGTSDGSVSYTYGNSSMTGEISHATKTGYHLNGYYTAASSETKILNADGTIAGNSISVSTTAYTDASGNWAYDGTSLTLYAQWTIDTYDVEWEANGTDWTGSDHNNPSTSADYNTKPAKIPTAPTSAACDGSKSFVGWTDKDYSHASTAPSPLFTTQATAPAITGDTKFRAVFATVSGGTGGITQSEVTTAAGSETEGSYSSRTSSSASGNWTGSYAFSTQNSKKTLQINATSGNKIVSPEFDGNITQITLVYTSNVGSNKTFTIKNGDNTMCTLTATANAKEGSVTSSSISGSYSSFTITANNALYIHSISVTYGSRTNYSTACCLAPTDPENGANTASNQTVSWTAPGSAPASGYLVAYSKTETSAPSDTILNAGTRGNYTVVAVAAGTTTTTIPCNAAGTYNWWVRSKCSASNASDWVEGDDWTMNNIYLNTNYDWNAGDARFAVYYWNDDVTPVTGWSKLMTEVSGCYDGIYTCVIPSDYNNVIFGRFSTDQTTDPTGWTNKWNQTSDLTIPTSPAKDYFTLSSKTGDNDYNGSWSNYAPYYTISFNNNAVFSTTSAPSSQCILEGAKASAPTNPKAMGKTVNGWYTEAGCENEWDFSTRTVSAGQTLYAEWEDVATKTIYLDCSASLSGSKEWDADNVALFAHAYIDETSLYTDVKATGAINSCDNHVYAFTIPGNADYVTFARCATGASSIVWEGVSANVYNQITAKEVEANKDWYKVSDWDAGSLQSTAFAATTYTVTFAANSGTGTMSDDAVECDNDYTIKTNAYTRGCYAFTGWKADVDVTISSSTVSAGTLIDVGSTIDGVTSNITLTAQWSQYSCTVTLDKNGATTGSNQTVSATCGSAMPLSTTSSAAIAIPSKTGYTFLGYWDTGAESGGNQYYSYDGSTLSSSDWDKETNTTQTLYARWEAKVDHFIDDMHGTTGYTGDGHSESGAGYTMPNLSNEASGNECETSHYIFVGWVTAGGQNDDGTIKGSPKIWRPGETNNASNATYYAVWAEE